MTAPAVLLPHALISDLQWRYAVKEFDADRSIPDEQWSVLEQALVLSPSSYGLQPWNFIIVRDKAVRQRLLPVSMGQRQIIDSSHLVVFAARTNITEADICCWIARLTELRDIPAADLAKLHSLMSNDIVSGPRSATIAEWTKRQVYLALGVFLTAAAVIGIDTCPMEGFDPKAYDEILGLTARGYTAAVIATAGYRSPTDPAAEKIKVRYDNADLVISI